MMNPYSGMPSPGAIAREPEGAGALPAPIEGQKHVAARIVGRKEAQQRQQHKLYKIQVMGQEQLATLTVAAGWLKQELYPGLQLLIMFAPVAAITAGQIHAGPSFPTTLVPDPRHAAKGDSLAILNTGGLGHLFGLKELPARLLLSMRTTSQPRTNATPC